MPSIYDYVGQPNGSKKKSIYDYVGQSAPPGLSSLRLDAPAQPAASTDTAVQPMPMTSLSDLAFGAPADLGVRTAPRTFNTSPTRFIESFLGAIDRTFGVPKSLDDLNLAQIPRTMARGVVGAAGFIPSVAEQLISPPEGQSRGEVAGEAGKGLLQMIRRFPIQMARLAGIEIDPSKPLNPIDEFLINQKLVQLESMEQIEQGLLASPEEPFFSAAIGSGLARGLKPKAKPTALPATENILNRKFEIPTEPRVPLDEAVARAEQTIKKPIIQKPPEVKRLPVTKKEVPPVKPVDTFVEQPPLTVRQLIQEQNKAGAHLRLQKNPRFGQNKAVGGVDKDPHILVGTDSGGRSIKVKGTEQFIQKILSEEAKPPKPIVTKPPTKLPSVEEPVSKFVSKQQQKGIAEQIKKTEPLNKVKKIIGDNPELGKALGVAAIPTIAALSDDDETKNKVAQAAGLFGLFAATKGKKTSPRMPWSEAKLAGLTRKEWVNIRRGGETLETPAGNVPISTLPKETGAEVGRTVRWDKYDVSQKDMAKFESFTKDLGLSTRSVRTFEDMKRAAAEIGTRPEELLSMKNLGTEEHLAVRNYLNATSKYISNLEKKMSADPNLAGEISPKIEAADQAIKLGLKKLLPASTEAGRTVVSYRILANGDLTPELWYRRAIKELGDTEQFTPKVRQTIDGFIESSDLNGLVQYVTSLRRADWIEKTMNVRKAGLLTSPVTHTRNLGGNFVFSALESLSNPVSAGMDFLVKSLWTGRRTESYSLGGIKEGAIGLFKEGPKKAWQYLKTGQDPYGLMKKWDIHRQVTYDSEILNKYTQGVYRVLGAEDKVFFEKTLRGSLFEQARVQAMNEGLKMFRPGFKERTLELFNKPTDEMIAVAMDEGFYVTFRKPNALSDLVTDFKRSQLHKVREAETPSSKFAARAAYGLTEQFLPFAVTPSAIAKNIFIDYTPAGGLLALLELPKIKESAFAQRRFVKGMGRSVTGTGLITLGYLLASQDKMTGKSPDKASDRAAWEAQGKTPYSIRIGDQWVQVNSFTGVGNLMTFGADIHGIAKSEGDLGGKALRTGAAALTATTELSPLKGIQQAGEALKDPERAGARIAGQQLGSFVPSIVAQAARMADSKLLKPSTTGEALKSRIPGMRGDIPPRRDIFGEEVKIETSTVEQAVSPVFRRTAKNQELMKELERLDVDISYPSESVKGTKLTGQQYDKYLEESGKQIKITAERIVKGSGSDEGKRRAIERNIDRIRTQTRYKLFPELMKQRTGARER